MGIYAYAITAIDRLDDGREVAVLAFVGAAPYPFNAIPAITAAARKVSRATLARHGLAKSPSLAVFETQRRQQRTGACEAPLHRWRRGRLCYLDGAALPRA